jgi:hypothetical protein
MKLFDETDQSQPHLPDEVRASVTPSEGYELQLHILRDSKLTVSSILWKTQARSGRFNVSGNEYS